jgi:hypothetical protein
MLQSPLTRKPSGSSTRGVAQNELSKYYKQQVLQELASQEARSRDLMNIQDGRVSSKRRSQLEDTGTVPGRSVLRSRSQDGRRSSTSLSRYNSYSSDDEGKLWTFKLHAYQNIQIIQKIDTVLTDLLLILRTEPLV